MLRVSNTDFFPGTENREPIASTGDETQQVVREGEPTAQGVQEGQPHGHALARIEPPIAEQARQIDVRQAGGRGAGGVDQRDRRIADRGHDEPTGPVMLVAEVFVIVMGICACPVRRSNRCAPMIMLTR